MSDWTTGMKKLALQAYENSQPCDLCFGTIVSTDPLTVTVEHMKVPLLASQLLVCESLKEKRLTIVLNGSNVSAVQPGQLTSGAKILLLKKSGGQLYVILDRIEGGGTGVT